MGMAFVAGPRSKWLGSEKRVMRWSRRSAETAAAS
jgi:hypothetical protein